MELSTYAVGALLGGTSMSLLSAVGTYAVEKTKPTTKTLSRDFILGAVLLLLILQLLPESTGKLIHGIIRFATPAIAATARASF